MKFTPHRSSDTDSADVGIAAACTAGLVRPVVTARVATAAGVQAWATEPFPSRPIRIIVPKAAGGWGDSTTRLVAQRLLDKLGQPAFTENKPGVDGLVGIRYTKAARADGYTLLSTGRKMLLQPLVKRDPGFKLMKDFVRVGPMARSLVLMVTAATRADRSVQEFLAGAKAAPRSLSYGSAGVGSATHIPVEMFVMQTGVELMHVLYKGNAADMPDLIAGRITMMFDSYSSSADNLKGGRLKALGVAADARLPVLPDVPTFAEQGLSGFNYYCWLGLFAPAATPKDVVQRLSTALAESPFERRTQGAPAVGGDRAHGHAPGGLPGVPSHGGSPAVDDGRRAGLGQGMKYTTWTNAARRRSPQASAGRSIARVMVALVAAALLAPIAYAQRAVSYPSRTVNLIVGFPPGGSTDLLARLLARRFAEEYQQPFVVLNKPGANSILAFSFAAKTAPDGHNLLMATFGLPVNKHLYKGLGYALEDFDAIGLIAKVPNVLIANKNFKASSVGELVRYSIEHPKSVSYASPGVASSQHLAGELFRMETKADLLHVPFNGSGPSMTAVRAGEVQVGFDNLSSAAGFIKSGELKALAVTSDRRSPAFPDVPTVAEAGYPKYELSSYFGLAAPAGTPAAVVHSINQTLNRILQEPAVREQIVNLGLQIQPTTPAEFKTFLANESTRWEHVIKTSGIQAN
ncbi:tripartite tricarboxylate transporter substrate-binding protein [Xylophilus sp. GW821-FHT01B05]